jgi:uncharacterized damage-inducible protein DinB
MNWTQLLTTRVDEAYRATGGLLGLLKDADLTWKPPAGSNWMTTGQLLEHMTTACGHCVAAFVDDKWEMPEGAGEDGMLPPASKMPSAKSVADARSRIEADHKVALAKIAAAGEQRLASEQVAAPWNPQPQLLARQVLDMVGHLENHKAQLFFYLKQMGRPVHTGHLYGMPG